MKIPLLKRKKKSQIDPVYFKKQPTRLKNKRKKTSSILKFRRSDKSSSLKKKRQLSFIKHKYLRIALKYFLILFIPTALIFLSYRGVKSVISIRVDKTRDVNGVQTQEGQVIGFEGVPIFPNSEFVFQDYKTDDSVRQFITSGKAIYRLPIHSTAQDVYDFYNKDLPQYDWEHVLSVERASEVQKYGEYWVRKDEGLRIHSEINDIWYEKISVKDAKTGLKEEVEAAAAHELVMAGSSTTELLPDFPWELAIPNEYLIAYHASNFSDLRGVSFKKIGGTDRCYLEPIGKIGSHLDALLTGFLSSNKLPPGETDPKKQSEGWATINSFFTEGNQGAYLEASITNGSKTSNAYVLENSRSNFAYLISSFDNSDTFCKFLVKNLTVKKSGFTGDDFNFETGD
ncbi:hypothetical protein H6764_01065 [Candidatus Nomurabacteria bacterium]|nr:hypothetical protein [Candidatus Nomurabacteria bacterium]